MKEATGELNMTVITIVAIAAIAAFLALMWPKIQEKISNQWDSVDKSGNEIINSKTK